MNDPKKLPRNIWFTIRWMTGYFLDILLTFGGVVGMVWARFFYAKNPLRGLPLIPDTLLAHPAVSFSVAVGVFAAFMAGRQWVRAQYFTHVLPEVWADTVQNFIRNAKKEEEDRDRR